MTTTDSIPVASWIAALTLLACVLCLGAIAQMRGAYNRDRLALAFDPCESARWTRGQVGWFRDDGPSVQCWTAASDCVPVGANVFIRQGGKQVLVRVKCRLTASARRRGLAFDLSESAFAHLAPTSAGVLDIEFKEARP